MKSTAEQKEADIARFATKVRDEGEHAVWTGRKDSRGRYGVFRIGGRMQRAHRVAWELMIGKIPPSHLVRIKCKLRFCVLPAHLALESAPIKAREDQ